MIVKDERINTSPTISNKVYKYDYGNSINYYSCPIIPKISHNDIFDILHKLLCDNPNIASSDVNHIRKLIANEIQKIIQDKINYQELPNIESYFIVDKFIEVIKKPDGVSINGLVIDIKECPDFIKIINVESIPVEELINNVKAEDNYLVPNNRFRQQFPNYKGRPIDMIESIGFYIIIDNSIYYISKEEYNEKFYPIIEENMEWYYSALKWFPSDSFRQGLINVRRAPAECPPILRYTQQVVKGNPDYLAQKPSLNLADIDTERWTIQEFIEGMAKGDKEIYTYLQSRLNPQDTDAKKPEHAK